MLAVRTEDKNHVRKDVTQKISRLADLQELSVELQDQ